MWNNFVANTEKELESSLTPFFSLAPFFFFNPELQLINTKSIINNKLKQSLSELKKV